MRVETIVYRDITFRRYPDSKDWSTRRYYGPGILERQSGVESLHREVYKDHFGPIPDGCDIHHADFDQDNNEPSNLVCLTKDEHIAVHRAHVRAYPDDWAEHMARISPLAAVWHRSDEGRAWHREHARKTWEGRRTEQRVCAQCEREFESRTLRDNDRFCSNNCKSAWRRASGIDNETRVCERCGKPFVVNRYWTKRFCSRHCGQRARRDAEAAGLQPDG